MRLVCNFKQVLGNEIKERVAPWEFPWKDGKRQMEKKNQTGGTSAKCIVGLKLIADVLFDPKLDEESLDCRQTRQDNDTRLKQWHKLMDTFIPMIEKIEQKDDFSDQEIDDLHKITNSFMEQWVDMFNGKHITNYLHYIGAGHLAYYLDLYRNLYRFSQQGWEALNQLLKHYYFNNTNHGGSCGNGGLNKDGTI